MDPLTTGAIISGAFGLAGGLGGSALQQHYNKQNYQHRFQWMMDDMRRAGLNPILAASGGFSPGAGVPGASIPNFGNFASTPSDIISALSQKENVRGQNWLRIYEAMEKYEHTWNLSQDSKLKASQNLVEKVKQELTKLKSDLEKGKIEIQNREVFLSNFKLNLQRKLVGSIGYDDNKSKISSFIHDNIDLIIKSILIDFVENPASNMGKLFSPLIKGVK